MPPHVVMITGCSSGIGRALAAAFVAKGSRVIATARNQQDIADLAGDQLRTLPLDVTDGDAIRRAVRTLENQEGRLDILINNAGYGLMGPLLDLPAEAITAQLRTNVEAPLAVIREAVPLMRAKGGGMIVNMGSISGAVATPFAGAYCASKSALHALSTTLRMELAPFGIHVVSVEPGGIASRFGSSAKARVAKLLPESSWYAPIHDAVLARADASQEDAMPADLFADKVVASLLSASPPDVIRLGRKSRSLPLLQRLLPRRVFERKMRRMFHLDDLQP